MFKDFGEIDPSKKVFFSFGEPMTIKNRGVEENNVIIAFIEKHLNEWNKKL